MSVSRTFFSMLCSAGLALAVSGCASDDSSFAETGSVGLRLELATDVVINQVDYLISGNGITPISGSIDTSAPGATASVEVFGLPPGQGYLVELSATSEDGETSCAGSAPFGVTIGVSTDVMVVLSCKGPPRYGSVRVNGKFNLCAELRQLVASPLQTSVGHDIDLSAITVDEEGDAVEYLWTGTGGSIADPNAEATTYTCEEVGQWSITLVISDDGFASCMDQWTVPVTCVEDQGDLCEGVTCEDTGNECTAAACNPSNGACEVTNVEDGSECDGGAGSCAAGVCVAGDPCEGVTCEDTGNECTAAACSPSSGLCDTSNVDDGTECDGGDGSCQAGECVNGEINVCAEILQVIVSPLQTSLGNVISLSVNAQDEDGDPIEYFWSGTGGTVADPAAASTTYTCGELGAQSITIMVSDDAFEDCIDEVTVPVTCVGVDTDALD